MVRLKVFHLRKDMNVEIYFNSYMVRLKDNFFNEDDEAMSISIPIWYD